MELDVNLLKSEIGIMAFGKRMRIANAITDLRRPPSITYSDRPEPSPSMMLSSNSPQYYDSPQSYSNSPKGHSRNVSQPQSHHSYPGSFNGINTLLSPDSTVGDLPSPVASTMVDSTSSGGDGLGLGLNAGSSTGTITVSHICYPLLKQC